MGQPKTVLAQIRVFAQLVSLKSPRHYILMLGLTAFLSATAGLSTVVFLGELNKALLGNTQARIGDLKLAAILLVLIVLASYSAQRIFVRTTAEFSHDMRVTLSKIVGNASLERIDQVGTHKIMTVLIDDLGHFVSAMDFLRWVPPSLFIIPSCIGYLLYLDTTVGAVVLIAILLLLVFGRRATLYATDVLISAREEDERIRAQVTQLVEGTKEIKLSLTRRDMLVQRDLLESSLRATKRYAHCMFLYRGFDEIVKILYFGSRTLNSASLVPAQSSFC